MAPSVPLARCIRDAGYIFRRCIPALRTRQEGAPPPKLLPILPGSKRLYHVMSPVWGALPSLGGAPEFSPRPMVKGRVSLTPALHLPYEEQ